MSTTKMSGTTAFDLAEMELQKFERKKKRESQLKQSNLEALTLVQMEALNSSINDLSDDSEDDEAHIRFI